MVAPLTPSVEEASISPVVVSLVMVVEASVDVPLTTSVLVATSVPTVRFDVEALVRLV